MSLNLIDLIKGQLGPALQSQAASQLGESESGISKAISGFLPAIVGGLANHSNNQTVLNSISSAASTGLLGNLMGAGSHSGVTGILSTIFGDKLSALINAVSGFAGIKESSAGSLLNTVTGATVGSVSKYAADNNLDASGVTRLLDDQKGVVSTLMPAGLSLASLGMGNWLGGNKETTTQTTTATHNVNTSTPKVDTPRPEVTRAGDTHVHVDNGGNNWWKWLLPLLLLGLLSWFLWKRCNDKKVETPVTNDTTTVTRDTATTTTTTTNRVDEDIDLNGTPLKGYRGGMEDNMITYLKSGKYKTAQEADLKDTWYNFDHVNFKIDSSTELEAGSEGQLQNLAAILKAYPDAKIKIGGYTDKTGNEDHNKKLSADRANFIKSWLTKNGVGAQITGAEGYGSQFATVDASASNEERAVDRKMAVRFAK